MELERHEYDRVVIGAGGAGLRAAIEAHALGAKTAIGWNSLLGQAHTVMAEGGIAARAGIGGAATGIDVFMECTLRHLLNDGQRVTGAIGYWRQSGKLIAVGAKAVVLATGGVGKAWKVTSNSWEYTGDGIAMALEAGADLIDMEMTQFHPTAMV